MLVAEVETVDVVLDEMIAVRRAGQEHMALATARAVVPQGAAASEDMEGELSHPIALGERGGVVGEGEAVGRVGREGEGEDRGEEGESLEKA